LRILDLKDGFQTLIDDEDLERLGGRSVYLGTNGYAYLTGSVTLHSFVLGGAVTGKHIDHINGEKLDNRRANLRVVDPQLNQVNRKRANRNNSSGARGVGLCPHSRSNPWRAQIMVARKGIHLGLYATKEEAIAARKAAELRYYGELCP
jgi:hypothetical protein